MNKNLKFNHRIILQKEEQQKGDFGETKHSFVNLIEVWGNITPINVSQNFSKMKNENEITHHIDIRYFKDAIECKRIMFGNRIFTVVGVVNQNETNEFITFKVKEIV